MNHRSITVQIDGYLVPFFPDYINGIAPTAKYDGALVLEGDTHDKGTLLAALLRFEEFGNGEQGDEEPG